MNALFPYPPKIASKIQRWSKKKIALKWVTKCLLLRFHFPGDVEQTTNELNSAFDKNEQYQEIAEYNIGIRKGPTLAFNSQENTTRDEFSLDESEVRTSKGSPNVESFYWNVCFKF